MKTKEKTKHPVYIEKMSGCEEPDLNRRTTSRLGPEPSSFDLARRSSRHYRLTVHHIIDCGGHSDSIPENQEKPGLLSLLVPAHLPIAKLSALDLPGKCFG